MSPTDYQVTGIPVAIALRLARALAAAAISFAMEQVSDGTCTLIAPLAHRPTIDALLFAEVAKEAMKS